MDLSKAQPKIWYYDVDAYIKSRGNNLNCYTKPSLSAYDPASKTMYFSVPASAEENHLGFEIMKDGKFVAYVWDKQYTDSGLSGTYTVNAYDRALNVYSSFTADISAYEKNAAKVGSTEYKTIEEAIAAAPDNSTVYLLSSATIKNTITIDGKNITIVPADEKNQTVIYNGVGQKNVFLLQNGAVLTVKTNGGLNNSLVFDGQNKTSLSYFRLNSGTLNIGKGVTVRRCRSTSEGSVAGAFGGSTVNLTGCILERNYTENRGTVFITNSSLNSSENTIVRYNKSYYSGGFIQAYVENTINIKDTAVYRNFGGTKDDYGTIRLWNGSFISIGDGTVIKDNQTDWYNLGSGIVLSPSSKAEFSGNINITDNVSISSPVKISPDMTGTLQIRPNFDYARSGNIIGSPTSGTFSKDILEKISFNHNMLYHDMKDDQVYISDTPALYNDSAVSGRYFNVGSSVSVSLKAHGGNGHYTYICTETVYDKDDVGTEYEHEIDSSLTNYSYKFDKEGKYGFKVKVSDSSGRYACTEEYIVYVYKKMSASVSATPSTAYINEPVKIKFNVSGGSGKYQYSVYCKKNGSSSWSTVKNNTFTPKTAGTYQIKATVKDTIVGTSVQKIVSINVTDELTNTSSIASQKIELGNTVAVTCSAKGGKAPYTYAVLYKKTSDTKWVTKQGFKENASVSVKPANAAIYDICAKVKDKNGTVEKKFFKLTVQKKLENLSSVSAETIQQGSAVTLQCSASGGSGYYNYAVYYKKTSDTKWTTKQGFKANSTVKITPAKVTTYDICVKVRDSENKEVKKYFKLNVTNAPLSNNSSVSSENIKIGESVTVKAVYSGGETPCKYAFYYKNINSSSWITKQDFSTNAVTSIKFSKAGTYNICVKIKDSKGNVAKKYFTVTAEN